MPLLTGLMNVIDSNTGCGFILQLSYDEVWWCDVYKHNNKQSVELSFNLTRNDESYIMTSIEQLLMLIEID